MRGLSLLAYLVMLSVGTSVNSLTLHDPNINLMHQFFGQVATICLVGMVLSYRAGTLRPTLRLVLAPGRRGPFLALNLLSLGAGLLDQVGDSMVRHAPGPAAAVYYHWLVGTSATVLFGWIATHLFEARRRSSAARPSDTSFSQGRRWPPDSGQAAWEWACTILAVVGTVAFVYTDSLSSLPAAQIIDLARHPVVYLPLIFALCQVGVMQITRTCFSRAHVDTASFMAWRYLIPSVLFGLRLFLKAPDAGAVFSPTRDTLVVMITSAVTFSLQVWFQYECLRDVTVVSLARLTVLVPALAYLIPLGIDPRKWQGHFSLLIAVTLLFLASELTRPWLRDRKSPWGRWTRLRSDPAIYVGTRIFGLSLLSILLAVVMFLPMFPRDLLPFLRQHRQLYLVLLVLPLTSLVLSMGFISRLIGQMVQQRLITTTGLAHDIRAPFHMLTDMLEIMKSESVTREKLNRYTTVFRHNLQLGTRLAQGLLDEGRADRSLLPNLRPVFLCAFLEEAREIMATMVLKSDAILTLDTTRISIERRVNIDEDRLFLVLYHVTHNSIRAWQREHGQDTSGLRIRWVASESATHLVLTAGDNGPGIPSGIAKTAMDAWITMTPGGNGLGLFLSRRYVELHGGKFTLVNQLHGGCLSTLQFPLQALVPPEHPFMETHVSQKTHPHSDRR